MICVTLVTFLGMSYSVFSMVVSPGCWHQCFILCCFAITCCSPDIPLHVMFSMFIEGFDAVGDRVSE